MEKLAVNGLLASPKITSADLLDVYVELVEVASELESNSANNWIDQNFAIDLAQLGAKTNVLSARVAVVLRSQIVAQEVHLAPCASVTPPRKSK
jgi:hypothetical protein